MSVRELARRTGLSPIAISRYVNGLRVPRSDCLEKICNALECDYTDLMGKLDLDEFKETDSFNEAARLLTILNQEGLDQVISYISDLGERFYK